jgi:predicted esterase
MNRRAFLGATTSILLSSCAFGRSDPSRLASRPNAKASAREPGTYPLGIRSERDPILYVPKSAPTDRPAPLFLYLHGATGSEQQGIRRIGPLADELGFILLSPASRETTWDGIREGYGQDVRTIDEALKRTFDSCRIDPKRIAVGGFSDGASYGLGLGLANGDLFHSVMAFSPGFIPPGSSQTGRPRIFISHGTNDQILPIDSCSRRLVPQLKAEGYSVKFREFDGPHTVPPDVAKEALQWFLA